jgi:type 1 fimbria pilin
VLKIPVVYPPGCACDIGSMISLEIALNEMRNAELGKSQKSFAISFLNCNRDKKTGGEMVTIIQAQKHGLKNTPGYRHMVGIYDHNSGKRMAVHERLIFKFNGQEVFW